MLQTHRLLVGEEQTLREIRLRSLRGEPSAYGSSYERENARLAGRDVGRSRIMRWS